MSTTSRIPGNLIEGSLNASEKRFAIVVARWNPSVTEQLLKGALEALIGHGGKTSDITVVRAPGSFEIPLLCKALAETKEFEAIIALGALIRGETDHYQIVSTTVAQEISRVAIETGVPITLGIIAAHTMEQALERAGSNSVNRGFEAAMSAIETVDVLAAVRKQF